MKIDSAKVWAVQGTIGHGTKKWHEARKTLIGASEIATIMGLSKYETAGEVWGRKKGLLPAVEETAAMRRGQFLESGVAKMFMAESGMKVWPDQKAIVHGPLIVTCDYRTVDGAPVEIKTAASGYQDVWEWQLQAQMLATGAEYGYLVWLDSRLAVSWQRVEADAIAHGQILWAAHHFVSELLPVDEWVEPVPMAVRAAISPADPEVTIEIDDMAEGISALAGLQAAISNGKKKETEIKELIANRMREATTATIGGEVVATWKQGKDSVIFDAERFVRECPDEAAKWQRVKPGVRSMRFPKPKTEDGARER